MDQYHRNPWSIGELANATIRLLGWVTIRLIATAPLQRVPPVTNTTPSFSSGASDSPTLLKVSTVLFAVLLFSIQGAAQTHDSSTGSYRLRFGDQLGLSQDLQLCGSSDSRPLRFYSESRLKPVSGSRLHLFLEHSPKLDGERSFLSVSLNYGILRSLRLDEQNEQRSEVVIPLSPELLRRENEFVFSVTQFPRDSQSGTPCTSIKLDSYIEIPYSEGESARDLSLFPAPFVDPHSYRPQKVSLLVPDDSVSTSTLQAIAMMAANLARQAGSQGLKFTLVRTIASADAPLIIIGTPKEQPELMAVRDQAHFAIERRGGQASVGLGDRQLLNESEGLVGVTTAARGRRVPILFVTANSSIGVLNATLQLLGGGAKPKGAVARISQTSLPQKKARRNWAGFIPPFSRFKLSELTKKEVRLGKVAGQSGLLRLDAPPDVRFLDYGHQMNLALKLAPGESPLPRLTLHLNGTLIGRFVSQQVFRGLMASVTVEVPARLLGTRNALELSWEGKFGSAIGPDVTLLPDSEFYLPRVYRAELPDLGLLQHNLYPFSLQPELEDLAVVIPDSGSVDHIALLTEIACVLGRFAPAEFLNFQVRRAREASGSEMARFNIITLVPEIAGDSIHKLLERWQPLPWIDSLKGYPRVQQQVSPWNSSKWVLLLEAKSVPALQEAVRLCFSDGMLKSLRGDSAILVSSGPIPFTVVRKETVEEQLYLTRLEAWMREHWVVLPIVLTLASVVLFVGLRVVLGNYGRAQNTRGSVRIET